MQFNKSAVDTLIKDLHSKGVAWAEIERKLNDQKLCTLTGLKWTNGSASGYAVRTGVVSRRRNTSAGQAGSTGYSKYNGKALSRAPGTRKKAISNNEIEEIMTSNLETSVKLKIIRLVAING